ncbi:MAG: Gfo/Idh/MocA family oxidoreductase [Acidaminococcaceae bacterium]|nr:Gfo/Idh/MocA family oxidoreductase [Acidaminococcaceae bacterium]
MERLKIGVIGTGNMGRNHVRNLASMQQFELVGIYDKNTEQARKVAAEYETKVFGTAEELLSQAAAVVIAVPSSLHKGYGLMAAELGVHALIEKPLATNSADARILADAFDSKGLKLAVGHIERFNPVIIELDKLLDNEQVFYIEVHRYSPFSGSGRITDTSVIEDLMIHDVDLVCHMMEPYQVTEIHGLGQGVRSGSTDFASCLLRFNGDAHAAIHASRVAQEKERSICAHTKNAVIFADMLGKNLTVTRNTDVVVDGVHSTSYRQNGTVERVFVPIQEPLRSELAAFYSAVARDEPVAVNGAVGIRAIEICEEVAKQAQQNSKEEKTA